PRRGVPHAHGPPRRARHRGRRMTIEAAPPLAPRPAPAVANAGIRRALATHVRPRPPGPVSTSFTFAWRALLKIKHVPEQLFDATLFPVMFVVMFTYLFGGALAGSTKEY